VSAERRTPRDERRRRLSQNFLPHAEAERIVAEAGVRPGELVVDIGAGSGALTLAAARRGARVIAIEVDPIWVRQLRQNPAVRASRDRIRVERADVLDYPLPQTPFRVVACLPFGATTAIMRRLLDDPQVPLQRADLIVQAEGRASARYFPPGRCFPRRGSRGGVSAVAAIFRPRLSVPTRRWTRQSWSSLGGSLPCCLCTWRRITRFVRAQWPLGGVRG
jgi:FkbM family methyltransferase